MPEFVVRTESMVAYEQTIMAPNMSEAIMEAMNRVRGNSLMLPHPALDRKFHRVEARCV